jgi:hypothetical protein
MHVYIYTYIYNDQTHIIGIFKENFIKGTRKTKAMNVEIF